MGHRHSRVGQLKMNEDDFNSEDDWDEDPMTDADVNTVVVHALGEVLNIASGVAELQGSDEAAEDIYAMLDLVAAYYGIARDVAVTEEHDDGSFTTRFESIIPQITHVEKTDHTPRRTIPGHVLTRGMSKRRIIDRDSSPDIEDLPDHNEDD